MDLADGVACLVCCLRYSSVLYVAGYVGGNGKSAEKREKGLHCLRGLQSLWVPRKHQMMLDQVHMYMFALILYAERV
jgi:hypothetical protein